MLLRSKKCCRFVVKILAVFSLFYLLCSWLHTDKFDQEVLQPYVDTNQSPSNFSLPFTDLHLQYQLYSPKVPNVCEGKRVVVFVASAPKNSDSRRRIRETWANGTVIPYEFLVQFIIGAQPDPNLELNLYAEAQQHNDIVRLDFPDTYRHLFVKTHAIFSWFDWQCPQAKYLIKMDDDAVLHLKRVDYFIGQEFNGVARQWSRSMFCNVQQNHHPFRNPLSKLYVPFSSYHFFTFPPYCQGGAYMATRESVQAILGSTHATKMLPLEDVLYTGIVGQIVGLQLFSTAAFCYESPPTRCDSHGVPTKAATCGVYRHQIAYEYKKLQDSTCFTSKPIANCYLLLFIVLLFRVL